MTGSFSGAEVPPAPLLRTTADEDDLAWDVFSTLYFPERRRHDLEALASYAAYKRGPASQDGGQPRRARLTLVPNEPEPDGLTAGAGAELQVWEGEGGFSS